MTKSPLTRWLKIVLPLVLGVFFVWYSIADTTEEERLLIWENIKKADLFWVFISILMGLLSHMIRANRWRLLLFPLHDNPKLSNCFHSVMFGYLANLGVPRSGEFLRGASYASYSDISFEQSFGTIITERIVDLIMLISIISITFIFQTNELLIYLNLNDINPLISILYLGIFTLITFLFFRWIKNSKNRFLFKIRNLLAGLLQGIQTILKMKNKWSFILQTITIWILYIAMFWIVKYAINGTENITFGATLVAFIAGSFAMSVTSGGIGLYPLAVASVFKLFEVPIEVGQAFGWIVWTAQTILVIVVGSVSAFLLPLLYKK